jgi:hypothetical protein
MAGRAEDLFGNAAVVSAAVAILAADLLAALRRSTNTVEQAQSQLQLREAPYRSGEE